MLNFLGLPVAASQHAPDVDSLISVVHWLMLVLFVGWGAFFVFVLVKFRKGANPRADYHGAKGKISKMLEIAIVVAEMVLLIVYAIPAWAARVKQFPAESEATVVRVVGEQFAWNVQYPGADGRFGRSDVTLVSADNPLGLLTSPRTVARFFRDHPFDVIFKGDDWRGTPKGERLERDLGSVGVEVAYFPYTMHTSSTLLRAALEQFAS